MTKVEIAIFGANQLIVWKKTKITTVLYMESPYFVQGAELLTKTYRGLLAIGSFFALFKMSKNCSIIIICYFFSSMQPSQPNQCNHNLNILSIRELLSIHMSGFLACTTQSTLPNMRYCNLYNEKKSKKVV